jgi:hypothetical protein
MCYSLTSVYLYITQVRFHFWLDDRAIGVRSPAEATDFSCSLCVQTGSGAHPVSCSMGTGGPFPGGKARPERDTDHSPPSSAEVMYELELCLFSPQAPPWRVAGLLYFTLGFISNEQTTLFKISSWKLNIWSRNYRSQVSSPQEQAQIMSLISTIKSTHSIFFSKILLILYYHAHIYITLCLALKFHNQTFVESFIICMRPMCLGSLVFLNLISVIITLLLSYFQRCYFPEHFIIILLWSVPFPYSEDQVLLSSKTLGLP